MKKRFFFLTLSLSAASAFAGTINGPAFKETTPSEPETASRIPFEFSAEYAYIADSTVSRGQRDVRDFDETYSFLEFVYTPRIKIGILRLGAAWERFSFGFPSGVQLEDTLQSVSAVVGFDTQFSDSILFRIEAQPGLYGTGDDLDSETFNVPFLVGGTYLYSSDLQFVLGASVNFNRKFPVIPGGGVRWRAGSQWVVNAVLPTPRIEFEYSPTAMFYVGANLKGSTFRVDQNFGTRQAGDFRLNNAWMDYTEVRVGLGTEIKLSPEVKLSFEGGYVPYREFDYHRTPVRYHQEDGAAYGSIAFHAAF
ncbi:MAG: DUF6268 family outer membrane beta-barrel protein [Chthoniobacterales bacterium]